MFKATGGGDLGFRCTASKAHLNLERAASTCITLFNLREPCSVQETVRIRMWEHCPRITSKDGFFSGRRRIEREYKHGSDDRWLCVVAPQA